MTLRKTLTLIAALGALVVVVGGAAGLALVPLLKAVASVGSIVAFGAVMDSRTEFADAVAFSTAGTGLARVGTLLDLGGAGRIGANVSNPLYVVISIDTAPTSGGSATVGFVLASDSQDPLAVDGTATEHFRTAQLPIATLVAGYAFTIAIPIPPPNYERYLGILQNVGVAALTAGKFNAFLTSSPSAWQAKPDALP